MDDLTKALYENASSIGREMVYALHNREEIDSMFARELHIQDCRELLKELEEASRTQPGTEYLFFFVEANKAEFQKIDWSLTENYVYPDGILRHYFSRVCLFVKGAPTPPNAIADEKKYIKRGDVWLTYLENGGDNKTPEN